MDKNKKGEPLTHGGKRPGAGRPNENKQGVKFTIAGDVLTKFKKKYPRKASGRVEEMMKEDLRDASKKGE